MTYHVGIRTREHQLGIHESYLFSYAVAHFFSLPYIQLFWCFSKQFWFLTNKKKDTRLIQTGSSSEFRRIFNNFFLLNINYIFSIRKI